MYFSYLFRVLLQRSWLIGLVGLLSAILAYWFVGRQPDVYQSQAIMATGIINYKGITSSENEGFVQEYQINNAFSNLIDYALSRASIKLVQIALTRHDLTAQYEGVGNPYREPNRALSDFSDDEGRKLLGELKRIDLDSITDPSFGPDFDRLLNKVSGAYQYDHDAILRQISMARKGQTDYVVLTARTESAELSEKMANTFANVFMTYYHNLQLREKRKTVDFYNRLAREKRGDVDSIQQQKFAYLYEKGLPQLDRQSQEVIATLSDLEGKKREAEGKAQAAKENILRLDKYLDELSKSSDKEATERIIQKRESERLTRLVNELTRIDAENNGADRAVKQQLDLAREELDETLSTGARNIGTKKPVTKERLKDDLYRDRIDADLRRGEAQAEIDRIEGEITSQRKSLSEFVLNDAVASNFDAQQERAEEEFVNVNDELVKAKLELENAENPLYMIENALKPSRPESKKRSLISAFAGVAGATVATVAILLIAFLDRSLRSPDVFLQKTGNMHLLGSVVRVTAPEFDVRRAFTGKSKSQSIAAWQEHVRKLRNALKPYEGGVLLFVSPQDGDGKTFIITSLAYALAANNQRALMIDVNFKAPMPRELTDMPSEFNETINTLLEECHLDDVFKRKEHSNATSYVDVLGHYPTVLSPSEVFPPGKLERFLDKVKKHYAFVLLEAAGMNDFVDAREMLPYADGTIAVFDARKGLTRSTYETIAYMKTLEDKLIGSILNQVDPRNLT